MTDRIISVTAFPFWRPFAFTMHCPSLEYVEVLASPSLDSTYCCA